MVVDPSVAPDRAVLTVTMTVDEARAVLEELDRSAAHGGELARIPWLLRLRIALRQVLEGFIG